MRSAERHVIRHFVALCKTQLSQHSTDVGRMISSVNKQPNSPGNGANVLRRIRCFSLRVAGLRWPGYSYAVLSLFPFVSHAAHPPSVEYSNGETLSTLPRVDDPLLSTVFRQRAGAQFITRRFSAFIYVCFEAGRVQQASSSSAAAARQRRSCLLR